MFVLVFVMPNGTIRIKTRGVGTGGPGGGRPPSFAKCPFSGSKVPFSCVKYVLRIDFFCAKGTFENLNLCYFPENLFNFRENVIYPKIFLVYPENFFHI
jgi:hypothetical protein